MLAVTQLLMRPTEIVGTADQIHARLQGLQTLGGMPTFARQRSQTFPHGSIEAESYGRIELLASARRGEQVVCFLKRSPCDLARAMPIQATIFLPFARMRIGLHVMDLDLCLFHDRLMHLLAVLSGSLLPIGYCAFIDSIGVNNLLDWAPIRK